MASPMIYSLSCVAQNYKSLGSFVSSFMMHFHFSLGTHLTVVHVCQYDAG